MKTQKSSLEFSHFPVMLSEVINASSPSKGGFFLDCTFGGGGYSKALLAFSKTKVVGMDRDYVVVPEAKKLEKKFKNRFKFYQSKFSQMGEVINYKLDAVIFDLGLSSIQLNNLKRGFSFKSKENLDMTMGLTDVSAEKVVNNLSESQLNLVIKLFGEEKESSKIAKNIVIARSEKKITKVDELVKIIKKSKKKIFLTKLILVQKHFRLCGFLLTKKFPN